MDHWGIYLRLNLQEHWCQNSWKSLLIIGPKMGAGPLGYGNTAGAGCKKIGDSDYTYYHRRKEYGGTRADQVKRREIVKQICQKVENEQKCGAGLTVGFNWYIIRRKD